jgi:hypothetical protein
MAFVVPMMDKGVFRGAFSLRNIERLFPPHLGTTAAKEPSERD